MGLESTWQTPPHCRHRIGCILFPFGCRSDVLKSDLRTNVCTSTVNSTSSELSLSSGLDHDHSRSSVLQFSQLLFDSPEQLSIGPSKSRNGKYTLHRSPSKCLCSAQIDTERLEASSAYSWETQQGFTGLVLIHNLCPFSLVTEICSMSVLLLMFIYVLINTMLGITQIGCDRDSPRSERLVSSKLLTAI